MLLCLFKQCYCLSCRRHFVYHQEAIVWLMPYSQVARTHKQYPAFVWVTNAKITQWLLSSTVRSMT